MAHPAFKEEYEALTWADSCFDVLWVRMPRLQCSSYTLPFKAWQCGIGLEAGLGVP